MFKWKYCLNKLVEELFVKTFIEKRMQDRIVFELHSAKNREKQSHVLRPVRRNLSGDLLFVLWYHLCSSSILAERMEKLQI